MIPAEDLSQGQRRFVVQLFFDVNPRIIDRFPALQRAGGDADDAARVLG